MLTLGRKTLSVPILQGGMGVGVSLGGLAGADKAALEQFTLGSLRKAVFDGDTVNGSLMAGQAAGLLHEVRPVAQILDEMVSGARQCIAALTL